MVSPEASLSNVYTLDGCWEDALDGWKSGSACERILENIVALVCFIASFVFVTTDLTATGW